MKIFMRVAGFFIVLIITFSAPGYFLWHNTKFKPVDQSHRLISANNENNKTGKQALKEKAADLRTFLNGSDYNMTYCFLVDMKISSGKKRFYVYNLEKDSVEVAGLVTHGSGSDKSGSELYFSNEAGSNCTSVGKYKIGKPYNGKFGLAYKLYGLDKTNSNAFYRNVVLHSHLCVPDSEIYPLSICESWGCPTVSPAFLQSWRKYIDRSEKPILLSIYK